MIGQFRPGNTICIGSTRSGKSMAAVRAIVAAAESGWAVLAIDPHNRSLVWNALVQLLARGHEHRILYDSLSEFSRVPGYGGIRPSTARSALQRVSENEELCDQYADLFSRGQKSLADSPLKYEGTRLATQLLVNQQPVRPDAYFRYAFETKHRKFLKLLHGCTHPDIRYEFQKMAEGVVRPSIYASSRRMINMTVGSTAYLARSRSTLDLATFFNRRGLLLVEGGGAGVSEDSKRTIMGALILRTIQFIRARRKSSPRLLLVVDEATNAGLLSEAGHEVRAMAECQKYGLDFLVLVQQPSFSKAIADQLFSNCRRHEWFYNANHAVCKQAASDLGDPALQQEIAQLKTGERYVKDSRRIHREYVPLLNDPWVFSGLAEKKTQAAIERIRRREEYYSPEEVPELWSPDISSSDVNGTSNSLPVLPSTSASSDTSRLSSPAQRLHTGDSTSSHDENDSA